jgi:hypothetical protein
MNNLYYIKYIIILSGIIFINCNKTTLYLTKDTIESPTYESRTESYLLGYYEFGKVEEWICESGTHNRLEIEKGFVDTIVHFIVGGVFTTRTNAIYCLPSKANIESNPKQEQKPK